jgi:diguanylate cyclase (GGDEF)-like protein
LNKIIIKFLTISIVLTILVTLVITYNFKQNNKELAIHNANVVSNVIKNGITNYMENDNMKDIDSFLDSIKDMKDVNSLWIVRSELINKQYSTFNEKLPRDEIDKEVLETGITKYEVSNSLFDTTMRITIPYKADDTNGSNCLSCHNVQKGDVLGAISLEMDLSKIEELSINIFLTALVLIFLSAVLILLIFRKVLTQYSRLFKNLTESLDSAIAGNFKKVEYPIDLTPQMVTTMDNFNSLLTTFKDTSNDIDKKLKVFIGNSSSEDDSKISILKDSKKIITNLSNLYQFKKEIELDSSKDEIYNRLSQVLINQFNQKNFTFVEIDSSKQKMEVIKKIGEGFYCESSLKDSPHLCRAARTKNDVMSLEFHNSCPYFNEKNKFHFCVPTSISKNIYLIINFVFDNEKELEKLKSNISFIKSYINESAPSIEVKILMEALKQSAFRDGLTGLYNRKFLEEHSKKLIPQANRENFDIGVLLLDMDHFKAVNDEYGHDIGDKVLKELSRILVETVRDSDIVVRYGGEEFMVLLINVKSLDNALEIANKIRVKVSQNDIDVYAGAKLRKTVSIGVSMFPNDSTNFESVIKNADIALYEAKNKGRNQVIAFNEDLVSSVDLF